MSAPDDSEPVKEFLRSLDHSLEALTDKFVDGGIKDGATLALFKGFSSEEMELFVRSHLRLDQLQVFFFMKCFRKTQ